MKRFVDLREDETGSYTFAWWDTIVDKFETHSGNMAWSSWSDFAEEFQGSDLERYKRLCPHWLINENTSP
jgi:hypothetical protein